MEQNLDDIWNGVLEILEVEVPTSVSYNTWIKPLVLEKITDTQFILSVPNEMGKTVVQKKFLPLIQNCIAEIMKKTYDIELVVGSLSKDNLSFEEKQLKNKADNLNLDSINKETTENGLNSKYTFDSFVVGNSNRFAHAACLAVAESPNDTYNPLLIYGGVGLGKTHLMHAIGHQIKERNKDAKIVYVSSERFMNDLIHFSIRNNDSESLREKYRKNIDVLMIDDIQFLGDKEGTQLEMFHTFNDLKADGKQIILSSDRPLNEIPKLEDRLRTRFASGLIADIQSPDFETRVAILKKKAEVERYIVPDDVFIFIATRIKSNIRELEGALIRVMAYAALTKNVINVDLAQEALKDIVSNKQNKNVTIELIQEVVANYYNLTIEDLKSQRRTRNVAFPRQIAMYLSRTLTQESLPKIGEEFGKDHTTVMHAHEKIKEQIESDASLKSTIENINKKLNTQN